MTKYILGKWEQKKLLILTRLAFHLGCEKLHDPFTDLIMDQMDALYEFIDPSDFEYKLMYKNYTFLKAMLGV